MRDVLATLLKDSQKIVSVTRIAAVLASTCVWSQFASAVPLSSGFILEKRISTTLGCVSGELHLGKMNRRSNYNIRLHRYQSYVNMHVEGLGWAVQNVYVDAADGFCPITTSFDLGLIAPSDRTRSGIRRSG
jgi:hypothetical protein